MAESFSPAYHEVTVSFMGAEGFPLSGILCEPTGRRSSSQAGSTSSRTPFRPEQCALLCHGFGSHKNGFHFPAIAHELAAATGMSSLRFDYTGNMDSPGPFRFASFNEEVQQMVAAKQFLEQQHGKQVVLLLGHSRGAINATLYSGQQQPQQQPLHPLQQPQQRPNEVASTTDQPAASNTPTTAAPAAAAPAAGGCNHISTSTTTTNSSRSHIIPLVVLVAGRYDLRLNMYQRYGSDVMEQLQQTGPWQQVCKRDGDKHLIRWTLTAEDLAARFAYDIAGACAAISSIQPPEARPQVLVVQGGSDPICEASDAANLAKHIAGAQLVEVEGADHWFNGREQQLLQTVLEFAVAAGRKAGRSLAPADLA